jgi:hypothetical protein
MITVKPVINSQQWWDLARRWMVHLNGRLENVQIHDIVGKDYDSYRSGGCTRTEEMRKHCVSGRCCAVRLQDHDGRCASCEYIACSIVRDFLERGGKR